MRINKSVGIVNKEIDKTEVPDILEKRRANFAFPFDIIAGTINNTEFGEIAGNVKPKDFTQFQKIFTGTDSVIMIWQDSTKAVKVNEEDTTLTKQFEVGRSVSMIVDTETGATQTVAAGQGAEFAAQQARVSITCVMEGQSISYDDLFRLWHIPTAGTDTIFVIEQATVYRNKETGATLYTEIAFTSLNDALASSGQAVEQFIQRAAPGEGYAWPVENETNHTVQLDNNKLLNNPITDIQIEILGGGAFTAPVVVGRRVFDKDYKQIEAPKFLFPHKMQTPIPSETTKTAGGENNFYLFTDASVDVESFYTDWKDNFADNYDPTVQRNYEGYLDTDKDQVLNSNQASVDGDTGDVIEHFTDIYNSSYTPATYAPVAEGETPEQIVIDTQAIPYAEDTISLPLNPTIPTYFMLTGIAYLDTIKLPISKKETTVIAGADIPIVGGFLNLLSLGIPWGGSTTDASVNAKKITGIIPATLYDFGVISTDGANEGKIPLDLFRNDTADSPAGAIGTNSISQVFHFSLTDKVLKDGEIVDTVDLAQEGGWVFNGEETPTDPELGLNEGYVIDYIGFKALTKADYIITAYRYGSPLFKAKYQTRSKFTGAIREWDNGNKLSKWDEQTGQTIDYPEVIPTKPPTIDYEELDYQINIKATNSNEESGDAAFASTYTLNLNSFGETWESAISKWNKLHINIGQGESYYELSYNETLSNATVSLNLTDLTEEYADILNYSAEPTCTVKTTYYNLIGLAGLGGRCTAKEDTDEQVLPWYVRYKVKRDGDKIILRLEMLQDNGEKSKLSGNIICKNAYISNARRQNIITQNMKLTV